MSSLNTGADDVSLTGTCGRSTARAVSVPDAFCAPAACVDCAADECD
jgi:hypothetical protein